MLFRSSYNALSAQIEAARQRYKSFVPPQPWSTPDWFNHKTPNAMHADIQESMHRWIFTKKKRLTASEMMAISWYISEDEAPLTADEKEFIDRLNIHRYTIDPWYRRTNDLAFVVFDFIGKRSLVRKDYLFYRSFFRNQIAHMERLSAVKAGDMLFIRSEEHTSELQSH